MGLFGFKTKYDIMPKVEEFKTVVFNYNKVEVIKTNAKLIVPEGYWFLIGKRGKALDFFSEGEYFFNYSNLPHTCRRYNIDKVKKGKSKDKLSANFYFISKALCPGYFKTYRKAKIGTKTYGYFYIKVQGVFSYTVLNVKEFMQSLLNEYDYIKTGEAEEIINSWVGDVVLKELERKKFIMPDIIANSDIVMNSLKVAVEGLLETAGLKLHDFKIIKYILPKEYQEQSNKNLELQNNSKLAIYRSQSQGEVDDLTIETNEMPLPLGVDNVITNPKTKESLNDVESKADNIVTETQTNSNQNNYVPFGNFVITNAKTEKIIHNKPQVDNTQAQIPETKEVQKPNTKQKVFVDLNLNETYNNHTQVKRCLNCGAENSPSATKCILCGETFLQD